ncbi:MAG: hypothetical protein ACXAES_18650 [Promethearchaeota archaeon]
MSRITRFSSLEIIVITLSIICLFILAIFIGFEPILITGAFILIAVDSAYITYNLPKRKAKRYNKKLNN